MKRIVAFLAVLVLMFALVPYAMAAGFTMYFYDDQGWGETGEIHAWGWGDGSIWEDIGWPRPQAKSLGGGWYSIDVPWEADKILGFIFVGIDAADEEIGRVEIAHMEFDINEHQYLNSAGGTASRPQTGGTGSAKTGDSEMIIFAGFALIVSAAAAVTLIRKKKTVK